MTASQLNVRCRVAWPNLFVPRITKADKAKQAQGADVKPQFDVALVLPQDDPQMQAIHDAAVQCGIAKFGQWDNSLRLPYRPDTKNIPELKGMYIIPAKTLYQPLVCSADRTVLQDPNSIQDGDWCYVNIHMFGWDATNKAGGKGVSANLNGVIHIERGPGRIGQGGQISMDELFEGVNTVAATAPQPQQPVQPAQQYAQPQQPVQPVQPVQQYAQPQQQQPVQQPAPQQPGQNPHF